MTARGLQGASASSFPWCRPYQRGATLAQPPPTLGAVAEGELEWTGEDGARGWVRVRGGQVEVSESESLELSSGETERLLARLASGPEPEQLEALEIFESLQIASGTAVLAIAGALQASSPRVRARAAKALASLATGALPALSLLVAALDDPEPWVQGAAAEALGAIGPAAASALPALTRLQSHPSYGPAGLATQAIAKIVRAP